MKKHIRFIAFIVLIGVVIMWGLAPVVSKDILSADNPVYSPGLLVAIRGLLAVVVIGAFINKGFKKINKSYLITAIPAGCILAMAYIFQFTGLKYTVPSKNTFLENISCITIPIFMFIFVREKPRWYSVVAALICVIGSIFLVGDGFAILHFFDHVTFLGDGFSAIGGLFFGLDIAFTKVYCKDKDPLLYVFLQLCVLTVVCFAYSFIFEGAIFHTIAFSFDGLSIVELLFLGIVCTALCWVSRAWAMKYIDALTVSLLVPLSAVVATALSIAFGMEEFNLNLLVGGLIILLSIAVSAIFDYRRECQNKNINNTQQLEEVHNDEPNQSEL